MSMQVLVELQNAEGGRQRFTLTPGQYYMGKAETCAIVLDDPHVSRHHATLEVSDTDVIVTDNGSTNGTWFENQRIENPILLQAGDVLRMGTMGLTILEVQGGEPDTAVEPAPSLETGWSDEAHASPADPAGLPAMESAQAWADDATVSDAQTLDPLLGEAAPEQGGYVDLASALESPQDSPAAYESGPLPAEAPEESVSIDPGLGRAPVEAPQYFDASPATSSPQQTANAMATEDPDAGLEELWQSMTPEQQTEFIKQSHAGAAADQAVTSGPAGGRVNEEKPSVQQMDPQEVRARAEQMVQAADPVYVDGLDEPARAVFTQKVIEAAQVMVSRELERIDEAVKQQRDVSENPLTAAPPKSVSSEAPSTSEPFSYGELQPLMEDPAIHRIMINGLDGIYIDRNGQVEPVHYLFEDQAALQSAVARLLAPLRLDPSQFDPVMDTYLPDGTHLNAVFSPIAENGPIITLQKAQRLAFDASTFLQYGCCSEDILQFLGQCVDHRRNIIVTGTAGSGKSACLNMLSQFANPHERVVIIEDVPELAVQLPHAVRLQAGLARVQGVKGLSTQLLLNNTFSMRPDRIILGEFFPSGALDMLMSMNNSSASFLTTFDAHSARDLIYRIELGIVMRKPELPIGIIRSQAAHAVNIIVTMAQFPDGSRKIVEVSEVFGIEEGRVGIQPVFRFLQSGFDEQGLVYGHYEATGYVPSFYRHRERVGETMDTSIFDNTAGMQ